jgi:hypothetical protein
MKQFNQNNKEHPQQTTMEKTMTGRIQLKQVAELNKQLTAENELLQKCIDSHTESIRQLFAFNDAKKLENETLKKENKALKQEIEALLDELEKEEATPEEDEAEEAEEAEDEDDAEMEVYFETEHFGNLCGDHEHLKEFHDFHYYQCWGGGGDGGYIVNEKNFVFRVERNWGTPFSVEKVAGIIRETERDGLKFIRIV